MELLVAIWALVEIIIAGCVLIDGVFAVAW